MDDTKTEPTAIERALDRSARLEETATGHDPDTRAARAELAGLRAEREAARVLAENVRHLLDWNEYLEDPDTQQALAAYYKAATDADDAETPTPAQPKADA